MLKLAAVTKRYGARTALDHVDLAVGAGEVLALLGPNGAGKSTLVTIVGGLLRADSGEVTVAGIDVQAEPAAARRRVGFAPQETALYEVLTVRENLVFFADLVGLRRRARATRIDELAAALQLTALLDRPVSQLSGGERRRVHTAIAFLHCPPLLLLDEPTVGADIETRVALLEVVRAAAREGAAVVYSTHYLPEVESLQATVGILVAGRVIATGTLGELVAAHGRSVVELTFDGALPAVDLGDLSASIDGGVLRVDVADPARAVPVILNRLGARADEVRGVEVLRPSLDSVFLSLTGRRFDSENAGVAAP
jgi:ABC-2 type transport system ATP-binding protein